MPPSWLVSAALVPLLYGASIARGPGWLVRRPRRRRWSVRRPNASRLSRSRSSLSVLQQRAPAGRAMPSSRALPICIIAYSWRCDLAGRLSLGRVHSLGGLNVKLASDVATPPPVNWCGFSRCPHAARFTVRHRRFAGWHRVTSSYINIVLSLTRRKYASPYISRSAYVSACGMELNQVRFNVTLSCFSQHSREPHIPSGNHRNKKREWYRKRSC